MRNIVTLIVIAGLAWYGYTRYQAVAHRSGSESDDIMRGGDILHRTLSQH